MLKVTTVTWNIAYQAEFKMDLSAKLTFTSYRDRRYVLELMFLQTVNLHMYCLCTEMIAMVFFLFLLVCFSEIITNDSSRH